MADERDALPPWKGLGPDALTLNPDELPGLLAAAKRPVKAAMLDQSLLAGVGNIYADESLHRAGIHPAEMAYGIEPDRLIRLGHELVALLAQAVQAGGSTLRDYRGAEGQAGAFQLQHAVYGRAGEPCRRCGRALSSGLLAQRTTVWCDACQRPQSTNDLSTMTTARAGGPMASPLSTHSI
jgi:formamidopyrimidine-DNA glycosylase